MMIAFVLICVNASAQEKTRKEVKGDKYAFNYSFDKAINTYTHTKNLSPDGQRHLAECYQKLGQNVKAEEVYAKNIMTSSGLVAEDYYNYAMVLKSNGKYEESNAMMNKFSLLKPLDLRAQDFVSSGVKLPLLLADDGKFRINHQAVNSSALDFGPSYYKNSIVFASTKSKTKMVVRNYNWTGKPYWDMYVATVEGSQLKNPRQLDKALNGKMHDGPASFSKDGNMLAFTRNNYNDRSADDVVELQIQFRTLANDKWSDPTAFVLNNNGYSVGQPWLSANGSTIYFTSDMPGGFGGADLYRISKTTSGAWGVAENLGDKINTEGDEMFPFVEETNGVLFFTSDGRFGLGGLDVFYCAMDGAAFGKVSNAGAPLNTQYNDYAAIVDDKLNLGYFTSDRTGGSGGDDIYSVDLLKMLDIGKKIQGIAKDQDGSPVPDTRISLFDDKNQALDSTTSKADGTFSFLVDANKTYTIIGKKDNYVAGETTVNTAVKEYLVNANVNMLKNAEIVPLKAEEISVVTGKPILTPVKFVFDETIYFDLDKFNIRPDAATELDKIVKMMNENPDMIVELSSHADSRGTMAYNQILSNNREKSTAAYIQSRIKKPERIYGKGYGETQLVNDCAGEGEVVSDCKETEHQKNRRTEFTIIPKVISKN